MGTHIQTTQTQRLAHTTSMVHMRARASSSHLPCKNHATVLGSKNDNPSAMALKSSSDGPADTPPPAIRLQRKPVNILI
jgi:hypothetical protein